MWKFRLDRCFVLSLGSHGGGRTLGDGGGGGSGGGGAGAVRAASVTLVGKDKIPGEWYEHYNKYNGQMQCAASLSIITCPLPGAQHVTPALACGRRRQLPVSDHRGLLVQFEARGGGAGAGTTTSAARPPAPARAMVID